MRDDVYIPSTAINRGYNWERLGHVWKVNALSTSLISAQWKFYTEPWIHNTEGRGSIF